MSYALRSSVKSADLEIAEILLSLNKSISRNIDDDESAMTVADSEYIPEDDNTSVVMEDYVPDADEEDDDEDYVPDADEKDDDEDYVPDADEEDDEDYVPDNTDILEDVIRRTCSCYAKGQELPREFWKVLTLAHKNQVPPSFKRWMLSIPPVKSIYTSFIKRR